MDRHGQCFDYVADSLVLLSTTIVDSQLDAMGKLFDGDAGIDHKFLVRQVSLFLPSPS